MARMIDADGLRLLKQWEGCILYAYDDRDPPRHRRKIQVGDEVRGTLTIGYGHTLTARPGQTITMEEAERLLMRDLVPTCQDVESLVKVRLSDSQFAALVVFVFNVGKLKFQESTLLVRLNAGDYAAVPIELAKWNQQRVGGVLVRNEGLVNRRAAESGLWSKGAFVASASVEVLPPPTAAASPTGRAAIGTGVIASGGVAALEAVKEVAPHLGEGAALVTALGPVVVVLLIGAAVGYFLWQRSRRDRAEVIVP